HHLVQHLYDEHLFSVRQQTALERVCHDLCNSICFVQLLYSGRPCCVGLSCQDIAHFLPRQPPGHLPRLGSFVCWCTFVGSLPHPSGSLALHHHGPVWQSLAVFSLPAEWKVEVLSAGNLYRQHAGHRRSIAPGGSWRRQRSQPSLPMGLCTVHGLLRLSLYNLYVCARDAHAVGVEWLPLRPCQCRLGPDFDASCHWLVRAHVPPDICMFGL
ncbi:hypothetical protein HDU91_004229, partial [Kappamyces sp. JEL0680]